MTQMHLLKKAVLLSGVAIISFAATAQAGFEWKGPLEPPPSAVEAPVAPPADDMAPATSWTDDMAPQAPADTATTAPVMSAPVESAPIMASAPASAPVSVPAEGGEVLAGFGSGLPLVIALQQIVPPGYQYAFSGGVNPGVSVSWEGGKPWQHVLADTLARQGLGYRLQGSTVVISAAAYDSGAMHHAPESVGGLSSPAPNGMMSEPPADDMAPVAITAMPQSDPAAMPQAEPVQSGQPASSPAQTVTIHREKPSSLLERLGWQRGSSGAQTPAAEEHVVVPAAPEKTADAAMAMSATDVAAAPAAPPAVASSSWHGTRGQTLRDVLKSWSDRAGVELYWSIDYDYRLTEDVGYAGAYDEAVGGLLDKFAAVRPQPYGQLHQSSSGPRVLVVKSYDLTR